MKCTNCGTKFKGNYCPNCSTPAPEPPKKKKRGLWVVIALLVLVAIAVYIATNPPPGSSATKPDVIFDGAKFSLISPEELISIMGDTYEVEESDEYMYPGGPGDIIDRYMYSLDGGTEVWFTISRNLGAVVRMTYFSWDVPIGYENKSDILKMFNVSLSRSAVKGTDTGVALRYDKVSADVYSFHVQLMDSNKKTFEQVSIAYNSRY